MRRIFDKLRPKRADGGKSHLKSQGISRAEDTGLNTIYEAATCTVDIVAIHGDGGHYRDSWTHPDNQVFWLRDLLPEVVPKSRILSFGYAASKLKFVPAEEISFNLLRELSNLREDTETEHSRPILFLAHSFGVILLKAALARSVSPEFRSIISSTCGIIFFGSPPDISKSLQSLTSMLPSATDSAVESADLIAMKKDCIWLQEAESLYDHIEKKETFAVTYYVESSGEGRADSLLVPSDVEQGRVIRMRKSHGMMIRFLDNEDDDFCRVKESILQIVVNL